MINFDVSHTRLRPLFQGPKVRPSGLLPSLVRPTGSKVEGRPLGVNDLLRMELMAEFLGKRPAFLVQERPWNPSSSTILTQWNFVLYQFGGRLQCGAHQN